MTKILLLISILLAILLIGILVNYSMNKQEIQECSEWSREAYELPNYYIVKWQKEQCDRWQIIIDSPVK